MISKLDKLLVSLLLNTVMWLAVAIYFVFDISMMLNINDIIVVTLYSITAMMLYICLDILDIHLNIYFKGRRGKLYVPYFSWRNFDNEITPLQEGHTHLPIWCHNKKGGLVFEYSKFLEETGKRELVSIQNAIPDIT